MPDAGQSTTNSDQAYRTSSALTQFLATEAVLDARGQFQFLDRYILTAFQPPNRCMTYTDVMQPTAIDQIITVPYNLPVEVNYVCQYLGGECRVGGSTRRRMDQQQSC
jgi:hypothetical protein